MLPFDGGGSSALAELGFLGEQRRGYRAEIRILTVAGRGLRINA